MSLPSLLIYFGTSAVKPRAGSRNSVCFTSVWSRWFPTMEQLLMLNGSAKPAGNGFLAAGPLSPVAQKIRLLAPAFFISASRSMCSFWSSSSRHVQLMQMISTFWAVAHSSAYRIDQYIIVIKGPHNCLPCLRSRRRRHACQRQNVYVRRRYDNTD